MGTDRMGARECYREVILDNIEYSYLVQDSHIDREQLDEIVDLIVDTVCSARKVIRIAGDDYPAEVVKSRFMKLDSSHVQYVMDCMKDNTTYVRNIKKYLLAALYNAPTTINSYYSSLVQHDMYGDGQRGRGYTGRFPCGYLCGRRKNAALRRPHSVCRYQHKLLAIPLLRFWATALQLKNDMEVI